MGQAISKVNGAKRQIEVRSNAYGYSTYIISSPLRATLQGSSQFVYDIAGTICIWSESSGPKQNRPQSNGFCIWRMVSMRVSTTHCHLLAVLRTSGYKLIYMLMTCFLSCKTCVQTDLCISSFLPLYNCLRNKPIVNPMNYFNKCNIWQPTQVI